ncbi:2-amino-4-hydroxy-6-hydroxymethyldihydropteridine diphosphokinase [Commensalibacter papalotli (ex Botero et al. 2024)]|uniref:2-amino-4-hydroxy-6-hydroxymethyldihydropteridine pyrophosphokinase n=1 Tax=Commensalibacter papalotli (ex Servin-Garciduenas et al. 2014) TaxID=1208583 RepID=W7DNX0_9PROT|nr:2-amino-4-hydroxy-6-hydroxymethyldihydropteridine diphosphokinase [Commensalibacter papalotli (ex Botero et al. 2024)]EUK18987.1 2-amino-4-hydroxy-6-hydroxymethyldihydropteridine pyrophosphokinase [Commensalibacter papalotli (ex Servin-Garciduenas et al. 2014)]
MLDENMIIIAVGSNLGGVWSDTPYGMCQEALRRLSVKLQCSIKQSCWYQTSPIPPSSQPLYTNGVVALDVKIKPIDLLNILNEMEKEAGRVRQKLNDARPLDLDILDVNGEIINDIPKLIVPHPRMHQRGFVLYPLRDIDPEWIHPISHKSVDQLISELPSDQEIIPFIDNKQEEI